MLRPGKAANNTEYKKNKNLAYKNNPFSQPLSIVLVSSNTESI